MSERATTGPPWYRSTLAVALVGSMLLWAALPPLALGWLGWLAPVPWLLLIRGDQMSGQRPYRALYLAGLAFWMAAIHWLRLPHPLVYLGWFALSAYLAVYLPVFVALSRVAVHGLHIPLWLAAPVVWTGLELARAHVMTGFMFGSLAHTQVGWTTLIQVSDLAGEYGVDFLIMLVAACVASALRIVDWGNPKSIAFALAPAAIAIAASLAYGHLRLRELQPPANASVVRIALIQVNVEADWKFDEARQRQIMELYIEFSNQALAKARATGDGRPPDLVVWPETMFRTPLMSFDSGYQLPPDATRTKEELENMAPKDLARLVAMLGVPVLVGIDRIHFEGQGYQAQSSAPPAAKDSESQSPDPSLRAHNSAVLVDRKGQIVGTYDKVHLVMFGEYVPFARWLPFLRSIASLTGSVEAGAGPVALCIDDVCYAPSICYETVIPHVIRRQIVTLTESGQPPDVLVNVTNDAWYWGSSELDQHLACGVFRAIETRRPLVIAANGGISAWVDHTGRVREQSPEQASDTLIADVQLSGGNGESPYMVAGDWFAGACLTCCVVLTIIGWRSRHSSKQTTTRPGDKETRRTR